LVVKKSKVRLTADLYPITAHEKVKNEI
jgi:hypothetical protein